MIVDGSDEHIALWVHRRVADGFAVDARGLTGPGLGPAAAGRGQLTGEQAIQFGECTSPALRVVVIRPAAEFAVHETHSRSCFIRRQNHFHS